MKKAMLIFDPAHGIDVPGKRSPDGSFEEWRFSRDIIRKVFSTILSGSYPFDIACPYLSYDTEPGLMTRVRYYNQLAESYDHTIVLSLHVDAFKNPPAWWNGTGFSFFTSREHDLSDYLANEMVKAWITNMPGEKIRANAHGDVSKDKNFTILYGRENERAKYYGILIENWFMDSNIDIIKLKDPIKIDKLCETYLLAIFNIFKYLGCMSVIPEVTIKP